MSTPHGKDTRVLVDQYDLSVFFDSFSASRLRDLAEISTFTKQAKVRIQGLADGKASFAGVYDGAVGQVDDVLSTAFGNAAGVIVTAGLGGLTLGNGTRMLKAFETTYEINDTIDDAVKISGDMDPDGGVDVGVSLHDLVAETTSANGAGVNNGAQTTNGWSAHLHITAKSGTTPTLDVKIQDSADGSAWADLASATFAQASAVGAQRLTGTGTVRQHVRAVWTIAGTTPSFTFVVACARR